MTSPYVGRTIASVVCAVRSREGEILLLKRRKPPYLGYWTVPGGKIEVGEHPADAAMRELQEETGITGTVARWCGVISEVVHDGDGESHFLLYVFELTWQSGDVAESDEGALRWFTESELQEGSEPIAHSDLWMIREMVLSGKTGAYVAMTSDFNGPSDELIVHHQYS